jgi:membrane protein DedA with SNARE-associated domain
MPLLITYAPVALGLFFGGTPALVAVLHLVITGTLNFKIIFILTILLTILWDLIWYIVGRFLTKTKLHHLSIVQRREKLFNWISNVFNKHAYAILFLSRFIYGTNSLASIVSGIHRMNAWIFSALNAASIAIWIFVLYGISMFTSILIDHNTDASPLTVIAFSIGATLLVIYVILYMVRLRIKRYE